MTDYSKPTRNHFTLIFERLGAFGVFMLSMVYYFLRNSSDEIPFTRLFWEETFAKLTAAETFLSGFAALGMVAVVTAVLAVSFLSWRKTFFYIDGNHLVYEKRTIFKKLSKLPIYNLATVNLERNVFERLVGTCKIKLDINSSATAEQTDFVFILSAEKGKQLEKELLRLRKTLQNANGEGDEQDDAEPQREKIVSFTTGQVFKHMVLSLPVVQLVFTVAFVAVSDERATDAKSIIAILGVAVAGYLLSFVLKLFRTMQFSVEADEKCIYITSGVLQKRSYAFEKSRINAVFIKQPFLSRAFGLYCMEVAVVGLGNDKKETPQLCLLVKKAELQRVMSLCAPDFLCTGQTVRSHPLGLLMAAFKSYLVAIIPCAYLWISLNAAAGIAVLALAVFNAVFGFITKTIAYDDRLFSYSRGILTKRTGVLKYGDMQTARTKQNLITRRKNVGVMEFSILSASAMKIHTTGYFPSEHFDEVRGKMVDAEV